MAQPGLDALAQSLLSPGGWHVTQGPGPAPRKPGLFPKKRGHLPSPVWEPHSPNAILFDTQILRLYVIFLIVKCFLTQWTHYVFYCFFDFSSLFQQSLGQSVCVKAPLLPLFRYIFHLAIHNIYLGKKYNSNIIHVAWVINLKCIFKVLKKDSLNFKKRTTKRYYLTPVRMAIFKKSTNRASLVVLWLSICQPMQGSWFDPCSGKISHAVEQLSPCITTTEPVP